MGEWSLDRLRAEYGPFDLHEETFTKPRDAFEDIAERAEEGVLGGARVLIERDDRILLARVKTGSGAGTPSAGRPRRARRQRRPPAARFARRSAST